MVRCEVSVGKIEIKHRDRCRVYLLCILAVYTCCVVKKTIESIDTHIHVLYVKWCTRVCHVVHARGVRTHELQHVLNFATIKKKV